MCGIAGYFDAQGLVVGSIAQAMASQISHRGPDDSGVWVDRKGQVALAHCRLSIQDLSSAGKQPMISANERWIIAFNGEIYNHEQIRAQLQKEGWNSKWRGYSDTETLIAAIQAWGVKKTLHNIQGMFAFALWDKSSEKLFLARDRLGEKPLYYGSCNGSILFASELKAITAHPNWDNKVSRSTLASYLRYAYVPESQCIFEGLKKLEPGHWVEIFKGEIGQPQKFWELNANRPNNQLAYDDCNTISEIENRLLQIVGAQMEADVPLGAFLSGGIDSSLIVSLMQAQSDERIRTFTIGFESSGFNEAEYAKDVAQHIGTNHTELYISSTDALNTVPELPKIWDEPFADSSQIPTLILSRMASQYTTVALSGDGADELFCGYNRYAIGYKLHSFLSSLPKEIQFTISEILKRNPARLIDYLMTLLPKKFQYPSLGDRMTKLGYIISNRNNHSFYQSLVSQIQEPESYVMSAKEPLTYIMDPNAWPALSDFRETMMFLDTMTYLPGDILTKVDRASMSASLEVRAPFLDHKFVEYAWSLPFKFKYRNGQTKWGLRKVLNKYVPQNLINRPKMGFGVPIEHWLRGSLLDWAEHLLDKRKLEQDGFFAADKIRIMWEEHLSGKRRWHHQLWTVLMFQAWLEQQKLPNSQW